MGTEAFIHHGDALDAYADWSRADLIISDGGYGRSGFDGSSATAKKLLDWYRPHVRAWSAGAERGASLWFWNTEIGWATIHPLLVENGWEHVQTVTWHKRASQADSGTSRMLTSASEVAALYRRVPMFALGNTAAKTTAAKRRQSAAARAKTEGTTKDWLRSEWKRSGLPMRKANGACKVRSAATRKWLTPGAAWYAPPFEALAAMAAYCNEHGKPSGAPYFQVDGEPVTEKQWNQWTHVRTQWNHAEKLTTVWDYPAVKAEERVRNRNKKFIQVNQKPLELMRRQIAATTNAGDVVWEPFGGLCSGAVSAVYLGRTAFAAELGKGLVLASNKRVKEAQDAAWDRDRQQTLTQALAASQVPYGAMSENKDEHEVIGLF